MQGQARFTGLQEGRGRSFALVVLIVAAFGILLLGYSLLKTVASDRSAQAAPRPVIPRSPQVEKKLVSLLPGQEYTLVNHSYGKIEVHSEYPIRIVNGDCHNDYAVQFNCEGQPATVFITDLRHVPLFGTPKANSITITATEF